MRCRESFQMDSHYIVERIRQPSFVMVINVNACFRIRGLMLPLSRGTEEQVEPTQLVVLQRRLYAFGKC